MSKKLEQLHALIDISALINESRDIREITRRAIEAGMRLLDAEAGSLLLPDADTGELFFEVALGDKGIELKEIRLKMGQGIAGWVLEHGKSQIVHDASSDPRFFREADEKSRFVTRNMLCVPLTRHGRTTGVLEVINKKEGDFDEDDEAVLAALANQVAIAIENAHLYQETKEAFYGTAQALVEAVEQRDLYTGGHTKRVKQYSLAIGRMLGLNEDERENLKLAAILHDIGKIGVRDDVLLKPGTLESGELRIMGKHPTYGYEILKHIRQLKNVVPGVKSHHERFDGTGYPEGLKGEAIPLIARIIAVADSFDAMTTSRPYRKSLDPEDAIAELRRQSGRQFDPRVVDAFFEAWKRLEIDI